MKILRNTLLSEILRLKMFKEPLIKLSKLCLSTVCVRSYTQTKLIPKTPHCVHVQHTDIVQSKMKARKIIAPLFFQPILSEHLGGQQLFLSLDNLMIAQNVQFWK